MVHRRVIRQVQEYHDLPERGDVVEVLCTSVVDEWLECPFRARKGKWSKWSTDPGAAPQASIGPGRWPSRTNSRSWSLCVLRLDRAVIGVRQWSVHCANKAAGCRLY